MEYEATIGLEVHAQLITKTKAFCTCPNHYGAPPNTLVCPVCLGMPGVLPVLNRDMLDQAMKLALAVGATIHPRSKFDRKNYFYPDLPKGYQISQYDEPFSTGGVVQIEADGHKKSVRIRRIHLEEDAGKSLHEPDGSTIIDMNRCGVPLVEIVSEPDMRTPAEARAYLNEIRRLVRWLQVCDGDMEKGSLRCDANVSVRRKGASGFGTATEVKNMNSIRGVERALAFEIERQSGLLESGGTVIRQTLLWDEGEAVARPMRRKETSDDYRYFPEPDLVEVVVSPEWIQRISQDIEELPAARCERFHRAYGLTEETAEVLTSDCAVADYFEALAKESGNARHAANWVQGEVLRILKEKNWEMASFPVSASELAGLMKEVDAEHLSLNSAKKVLDKMVTSGKSSVEIIEEEGLVQVSDVGKIERAAREVLARFPDHVQKYRAGKTNIFGFFVGEVMKATEGRANPKIASEVLKKLLS
ncbi:MAG: Asp-tRNA(Asn)/Glu-tRNA(Gln) amidotransferase subunit GatB [bacterium]